MKSQATDQNLMAGKNFYSLEMNLKKLSESGSSDEPSKSKDFHPCFLTSKSGVLKDCLVWVRDMTVYVSPYHY